MGRLSALIEKGVDASRATRSIEGYLLAQLAMRRERAILVAAEVYLARNFLLGNGPRTRVLASYPFYNRA